jgi:hypothetical protein
MSVATRKRGTIGTYRRLDEATSMQSIARLMTLLKNAYHRRRVGELGNKAEAGRHYRDCSEFLYVFTRADITGRAELVGLVPFAEMIAHLSVAK